MKLEIQVIRIIQEGQELTVAVKTGLGLEIKSSREQVGRILEIKCLMGVF